IIESCQVGIDIQDDGTVRILSPDKASIEKAKNIIKGIAIDPEPGDEFEGPVTRIEDYGVFVKVLGGAKEGMVHVSQMHTSRVGHPSDMVKLGDIVKVKALGMDKGKLSLTMKGIAGNPEPDPNAPARPAAPRRDDRGGRDGGRDNRGGGRDRFRR
ncbi:MAG: S1 RNA-binding domain-containing protein, partial [Candidatus Cloacimonetes bacterium]|nr:S1 RNA-binding domain-containing protein [Candidatus Cloacimonadota bacterium]